MEDIKEEDVITENNVRSIIPGFGMHPLKYEKVIGSIAQRNMEKGELFLK